MPSTTCTARSRQEDRLVKGLLPVVFNLPTYDIDITRFLGKLLNDKQHHFGFSVTNALDVWYIDTNLHLRLDHKSKKTVGSLVSYNAPLLVLEVNSGFSGLDDKFVTGASRHAFATGWVNSSYGEVTTTFYQRFRYANRNMFTTNVTVQVVNQTIDANSGIFCQECCSSLRGSSNGVSAVYLYRNLRSGGKLGFSYRSLRNAQSARGTMKVKNNLVVGGLGKTHQVYKYMGTDGCYFRDVSSRNYIIIFDNSGYSCSKRSPFGGVKFSLQ